MNVTWLENNSAGLLCDLTSTFIVPGREYSFCEISVWTCVAFSSFVGFGTPPKIICASGGKPSPVTVRVNDLGVPATAVCGCTNLRPIGGGGSGFGGGGGGGT